MSSRALESDAGPVAIDFESSDRAAPDRLPRGRHKLSARAVRASQRERLLRAMLECVAERGYQAATVAEVVAAARVSRNAYYELFEDKLDGYLALCDELSEQLLAETFAPVLAEDWAAAVRAGARRYLAWWQARPRLARAYLVELPTAGHRALEQRERDYARFGERLSALAAGARLQQPELAPLRPTAVRGIVAAITDIVAHEVACGRLAGLASFEDDLVWLTTRLLAEEVPGSD